MREKIYYLIFAMLFLVAFFSLEHLTLSLAVLFIPKGAKNSF